MPQRHRKPAISAPLSTLAILLFGIAVLNLGTAAGADPAGKQYSNRVEEKSLPAEQAAIDAPLRAHQNHPWVRLVKAEIEQPDGTRRPLPFWRDGERIVVDYESSGDFDTNIMMSHAKPMVLLKNERGETTQWLFTNMSQLKNKGTWIMVDGGGRGPRGRRAARGGGAKAFTPNMEIFVVLDDKYKPKDVKRFKISNSLTIGDKPGTTQPRDWREAEVAIIDESIKTKTGNTPKESREEAIAKFKARKAEDEEKFGGAAEGKVDKSDTVGETGGGTYEYAKSDTPLLGLTYTIGAWEGHPCIEGIRPLFEDAPVKNFTERVLAKSGYAVGGVNLEASPYFSGFQIIFMKLDGKKLNPKDTYLSDWVRAGDEKATQSATYKSDGKLVVGIHGNRGAITNTMGILYQTVPGEAAKNAPPTDPRAKMLEEHKKRVEKMRAAQEARKRAKGKSK